MADDQTCSEVIGILYQAALLLSDATIAATSPSMTRFRAELWATPQPGDIVFEVSRFDKRNPADPEDRIGRFVSQSAEGDVVIIARLDNGKHVRWANSEWLRLPWQWNPWKQEE